MYTLSHCRTCTFPHLDIIFLCNLQYSQVQLTLYARQQFNRPEAIFFQDIAESSSVYGSVFGEQLRVWQCVERAERCCPLGSLRLRITAPASPAPCPCYASLPLPCLFPIALLCLLPSVRRRHSCCIPYPLPLLCPLLPSSAVPFASCLCYTHCSMFPVLHLWHPQAILTFLCSLHLLWEFALLPQPTIHDLFHFSMLSVFIKGLNNRRWCRKGSTF